MGSILFQLRINGVYSIRCILFPTFFQIHMNVSLYAKNHILVKWTYTVLPALVAIIYSPR